MPISELILPRTSDAMTEAILATWLVTSESQVSAGDILAEVETEKAMVEVCAEGDGLFVAAVPAGATVEVGGVLAYVLSGSEIDDYTSGKLILAGTNKVTDVPAKQSSPIEPQVQVEQVSESTEVAKSITPHETAQGRLLVSSPLARKLAREAGLDLASIAPGSGPGGRLVRADIETAISRKSHTNVTELTSRQKAMASAMVHSTNTIPHFSISRDVPLAALIEFREQLRRSDLEPPSLSAFFVRALAVAMQEVPASRVTWVPEGIASHPVSAIGLAVADGDFDLVVPVIRDAESKSIWKIGEEVHNLSNDVKNKRLKPESLQGAIGTISNLGMFGIDSLTPIIPPGQTFIIGIGRSRDRLAIQAGGQIVTETFMTVTLSGDHRVLTGLGGAKLLAQFSHICENPILLLQQGAFNK
jgi:pyruvate dehydrogenase E2 component (dihydrolipoamide acetyltransferase)